METIHERKARHFEFFKNVNRIKTKDGLFNDINISPSTFSSISFDKLDLSTQFLGKRIGFPLIISSITGGFPMGESFNNAIGSLAERYNIPLCTGSIRPLFEDPKTIGSYNLKSRFNIPFFGLNISAVQALQFGADKLNEIIIKLKGDALFLHFNRIQELAQPGGDRDFIFGENLQSLIGDIIVPVILKETGSGMGKEDGIQAKHLGAAGIETAGAGGTSFLDVEIEKMTPEDKEFWKPFQSMGIPTVPSILLTKSTSLAIIGSGGVRSGLDIAKSLIIGADIAGIAAPFVAAWLNGGDNGLSHLMSAYIEGVITTMMLCGADNISKLKEVNYSYGPRTSAWLNPL